METEPERQQNLWEMTHFAIDGFRNMVCELGNTSTPIIPLYIRDNYKTFAITRDLLAQPLLFLGITPPTCKTATLLSAFVSEQR